MGSPRSGGQSFQLSQYFFWLDEQSTQYLHFRSLVQVHSCGSCPSSTLPPLPNNIRPDTADLFCLDYNKQAPREPGRGLLKIMAVFRATKLGELVLSLVARSLSKANGLTCSFVFAPAVIHTSLLKASINVNSNGF